MYGVYLLCLWFTKPLLLTIYVTNKNMIIDYCMVSLPTKPALILASFSAHYFNNNTLSNEKETIKETIRECNFDAVSTTVYIQTFISALTALNNIGTVA